MIDRNKYSKWLEEYFASVGSNKDVVSSNVLSDRWLCNNITTQLRLLHPEIDREFEHYKDFENYIIELIR